MYAKFGIIAEILILICDCYNSLTFIIYQVLIKVIKYWCDRDSISHLNVYIGEYLKLQDFCERNSYLKLQYYKT